MRVYRKLQLYPDQFCELSVCVCVCGHEQSNAKEYKVAGELKSCNVVCLKDILGYRV